jgi:hypothetical protein
MEYVLGLKKEMGLLDEKEAKERYLELLAMGYSEGDIIFAAPVPVQVHLDIGQTNVSNSEVNQTMGQNPSGTQFTNVSGLNPGGDELPSDTMS